jgi:hypothetical protein
MILHRCEDSGTGADVLEIAGSTRKNNVKHVPNIVNNMQSTREYDTTEA